MRNLTRYILLALTATVVLGVAVGSASANRLSVSNTNFRVTWTGTGANALKFQGSEGSTSAISCPVTLEGSFHSSTIVKTRGALIGHITRANVGRPCAGGTAWIYNGTERNETLGNVTLVNSLPWHVTYEGFEGTLPNITDINLLLVGARFLLRKTILFVTVLCIYRATTADWASGSINLSGGNADTLTPNSSDEIPLEEGSGSCPSSGRFFGEGTVTLLGNTTRIAVRLI